MAADAQLAACAAIVERGDPDRFAATLAAPVAARGPLLVLYALNLELARAAWISPEPMVCRIRLQWWIDVIDAAGTGGARRAHEVAGPVHDLIAGCPALAGPLAAMARARDWDIEGDGFVDAGALTAHLDAGAGSLMWAAALALGAPATAEGAVRDVAAGQGLAAWFCAVAALTDRGRRALPDPSPAAVTALAGAALGRLSRARFATVPRAARPALYPAWTARGLLTQAAREPGRVAAGRLGLSEFARRAALARLALTGRF
jgi:phytoene/squalene synthetase